MYGFIIVYIYIYIYIHSAILTNYFIDNQRLDTVNLGIFFDKIILFSHNCNMTSKGTEISSDLYLCNCSLQTKSKAYVSLVQPILEYAMASSTWNPHYVAVTLPLSRKSKDKLCAGYLMTIITVIVLLPCYKISPCSTVVNKCVCLYNTYLLI